MKNANTIFASIHESLCRRNTAIAEALGQYRRQVDAAKATYRDEVAAEKIDALTAETRQVITFADQKAADEAKEKIQELRKLLRAYVTAWPDMAIIDRMKAVKDFGCKLSKTELEGFAETANGNYVALSCVERLANENGYQMSFPDVPEYEKDLAEVEQFFAVPSLWGPTEFTHEAVVCSPNVVYHGVDHGRPNAYQIALAQSLAAGAADKLNEMSTRWGDVHYELTESETAVEDTNAQPKTPAVESIPEDTVELVRERAAEQAAVAKTAKEALERFKV